MQIARLAADRDMLDLTFRAVRESLQAGPPVVPAAAGTETRALRLARQGAEPIATDTVTPRVVANLAELERLWRDHNAPPDRVYEALRAVVLPPGRPAEVFLYANPPNPRAPRRAGSIGAILADWAVLAGKADDLRKAIDERRERPMAGLPAAVLTVQLALAAGNDDAAVAGLKSLAARLKRETLRSTAELACHAALPALERPRRDVAAAAIEVLDGGARGLESNAEPEPLGALLVAMARRQWPLGDIAGGRKHLDVYLEATDRYAGRLGGNAASAVRRRSLARVASEYARAGMWAEARNLLGRYADTTAAAVADPDVTDVLARAIRQLDSAPAGERYRTLHDWTMPAADRRSVRILASPGARAMVPDVFRGASPTDGPESPREASSSTAAALIDAARQAGTLDALAAEARAAAEQKIENAEVLETLVELARGQVSKVAPRIESRLAELTSEGRERAGMKPASAASTTPAIASDRGAGKRLRNDELVARAAIESGDPAIAALGGRMVAALLRRAERDDDLAAIAGLRTAIAAADARRAGAPRAVTASIPPSWHATDIRPAQDHSDAGTRAIWVSHQGHVAHPAGTDADLLLFDVPISGTYAISVDAFAGPSAGSAVLHNGYGIVPAAEDGTARLFAVGQADTLRIPWKLSRPDGFNRLTIRVSPGKVRYVVNGHLLHEDDDPDPVVPWLGLMTDRRGYAAWRHLTLEGSPTVPREVPLSRGDRLTGWVSRFYGETQPPRRNDWISDGPDTPRRRPRRAARPRAAVDVDAYDWAARDGVIHGRRIAPDSSSVGATAEADQSRLSYLRPMGDGDLITYEFFYEPGRVMVHPAVDRLAFLLEPEGVRLHWMTAGADDPSRLAADNAVDEPANRRGPRPIPLRPGEWNALKLSLAGDRVAIELNGQAVYERPLEPALGREFGLFHYKDQTSARVRNVVLKGNWPATIPDRLRSDLAAIDPGSDAMRRARHAIVGEGLYALEAGSVVEKARTLDPARRHAMLADWVLPNPDHPLVRLEGDFAPSYPAAAGPDAGLGGTIRSPAFELLRVSHESGKLDDLARQVEALKVEGLDPFAASQRGRLALLAMIQGARGDVAAAVATIDALRAILEKLPPDLDEWARWPELVVAERTAHRPEFDRPALAMMELLARRAPSTLWEVQVKHLRARAATPDGKPRPWAPVTPTTARSRGEGWPFPLWSLQEDGFSHQPGHGDDMLYFAAPIRGDFAVDCEVTASAGREIRLVYGGQILGLRSDGKHLVRSQIGRPSSEIAINPPVDLSGEWISLRLAAGGNRLTLSIRGRKVLETPLPAERDPWLALLCPATESGSARKVAISGHPQIPDRLALSALPDLSGWRADEYAETRSGAGADWEKRGDEIVGRLNEEIPGARQESVLRYHRPMLEDGRISYEFYYDPAGKAMVHPALDRLAFLLEPDGVRVHRLTDGAYERSGLAPDNIQDEPESRRGPTSIPLQPGAWNRLAVEIKGDKVILELNDRTIYERTLEPTNGRGFGLFHHADATRARVRNVSYHGQWPRSLPAASDR
jgi:hypothetical protein